VAQDLGFSVKFQRLQIEHPTWSTVLIPSTRFRSIVKMSFLCPGAKNQESRTSSPTEDAKGKHVKDSTFRGKMWALARSLSPSNKFALVDEVPSLPTVAFDLDGTLVHTLVEPKEIAAAQQSGLTTIRLPGNMGLVVQRPGLEQLFLSVLGYNVVLYSAGGSGYVNVVVEHLVKSNPIFQDKFCKILCRPDLTRYSHVAEVPRETSLNTDGVNYVKDLRKARRDGNSQKVLIVDDNPYAFEVQPHMKDDDFKRRHDFTLNAVPVQDFRATNPDAVFDAAFVQVAKVLEDISGAEDILAALKNHSSLAELKSEFEELPIERQVTAQKTPFTSLQVDDFKKSCQMDILGAVAV